SLADVKASAVQSWLAEKRRAGRMKIATSNYYLRDSESFFRWLVDDGRAAHNPLQSVGPLKDDVEEHRERRALPDDDFREFLIAARDGEKIHRQLGPDRFILYLVAGQTGFRAQELASLTPESFRLNETDCTVAVAAAYSKHKRKDVLPIRTDLA